MIRPLGISNSIGFKSIYIELYSLNEKQKTIAYDIKTKLSSPEYANYNGQTIEKQFEKNGMNFIILPEGENSVSLSTTTTIRCLDKRLIGNYSENKGFNISDVKKVPNEMKNIDIDSTLKTIALCVPAVMLLTIIGMVHPKCSGPNTKAMKNNVEIVKDTLNTLQESIKTFKIK